MSGGQQRRLTRARFATYVQTAADQASGSHMNFLLDLALSIRNEDRHVDTDAYSIMRDETKTKVLVATGNEALIKRIQALCAAVGVEVKQVSTARNAYTCEIPLPQQ